MSLKAQGIDAPDSLSPADSAQEQKEKAPSETPKKEVKIAKKSYSSSTNFKTRNEVATEQDVEYLDLVTGVYKDVKFEDLPDDQIFKLEDTSYRKYADLIYDNERKVMRFKPKKTGSFTLRFINKRRPNLILKQVRVTVQQKNLDKVASEIRKLLKEIEGIEIKVLNNKVIVDGYILLAKDMNRIAMVLTQYKEDQVASLVRLSPLTKRKIADRIEAEIDNPNIYVDVINDFYMLEGTESWAGEAARAKNIAEAHISDTLTKFAESSTRGGTQIKPLIKDPTKIVINNIIPVGAPKDPPKKLIQIVVHYVELSKDYNRGFNFSWAPTLQENSSVEISTGGTGTSDLLSSFTATINNLLPKLNWAREHGHARILNTMNVLVEEGQRGIVNRETTIQPIPGALGAQVPPPITARIGTEVTPETNPEKPGDIRMDIKINITEVLESDVNQVITSGNNVTTIVSVKNKQSAAIAGLLRSRSSTGYNRNPAGGDNVLFRLGASKNLSREHSQFVIFLTPIQKPTASQGVDKIKKKFRIDK